MKSPAPWLILTVLGLMLGGVTSVGAHAFAPSLLEILQLEGERFEVRFKEPAVRPAGAAIEPWLPTDCTAASEPAAREEGTGVVTTRELLSDPDDVRSNSDPAPSCGEIPDWRSRPPAGRC